MLALIDGDIICFRAAFSAEEDSLSIACIRAHTMIEEILSVVGATECKVFISGKGNFRYKVYPEYKANRINAKRPKWEQEVKDYLKLEWNAIASEGCEADDLIGVAAFAQGIPNNYNFVVCSIDKDLDQIPGWHWNFVKKVQYFVSPEEATRNFYYQLLVGDTADGIKGVPNIGPKKAGRILALCETEREMLEACREAYGSDDEMEMNAKCLWIWKKENDVWKWPMNERMEQST